MESKYIKKLVGDNVYLSPILLEDTEIYTHMSNNLEMMLGLGSVVYTNIIDNEKEEELLKELISRKYQFAVRLIKNDELLGNIGFRFVNETHKNAELGIMLANEKHQGKGYGAEAINLLLDFGFSLLNLYNIYLQLFEYNEIAYKLYKKVGFKEVGRKRKFVEVLGKRYDVIIMDILSEEFESKYIKKEFEKRYKF